MWSSTQFQKWNRKQNGEKDLHPNDDMARPFVVGEIYLPFTAGQRTVSCDLHSGEGFQS
jgi:hypothetical protein